MLSVKVYKPDPYTEAGSIILAQIANRVIKLAQEHEEDTGPLLNIISRLWQLDPTVLALAALDSKGQIRGHTLAVLEGGKAYLLQPRMDEPTEDDAIGEFITLVDEWLKVYNSAVVKQYGEPILGLTLLARRSDPKWAKKYNFITQHYVMFRPLGG